MEGSLSSLPSIRSLDELEAEITELTGHFNAAEYRWLTLVAEFDRRNGWAAAGCASGAHWLNFKCGIAMGSAREKIRVAHALASLPLVSASMARGQVSYSKVRAITRVATPQNEDYFLSIALHGTATHVERLVQAYRRAKEAEELSREGRQQAGRSVSWIWDDDGSLVIKARLPADKGALFIKAIDAAVEEISTPNVPAGTPAWNRPSTEADEQPSRSARRADACVVLAESFLKHGAQALSGGERNQIVVHVDAETLRTSVAGQCEIEHGPSLSAETARRFSCDSSVVVVLENEKGEPLSVGRKTRSLPPALRRALNARDRGCRFPGCTHTRFVDAHHVKHWANGGETKPSNLVTLCSFHHCKVHEGGVMVEPLGAGAFRFIRPDGRSFDSPAPSSPSDWTQLTLSHQSNDIRIDRNTAVTQWRGERMDYGQALDVLFSRGRSTPDVPAGTSA
jgi:Domain of unknown function (DUF222)